MRCSEVEELLSDYVDGALDVSTREEMERHLAACSRCSAELSELNGYLQAMKEAQAVNAPADFLSNIHQRIEAESRWRKLYSKWFVPMRIKLPLEFAGVLATAVLLVVFYQHTLVQKRPVLNSSDFEAPSPPVVSTPGERLQPQVLHSKVEVSSGPAPGESRGETATIRLNLFLRASQEAAAAKTADKDSAPALAPAEEAGRAGAMVHQQGIHERRPAALSPPPANGSGRERKDDAPAPAAPREKAKQLDAAAVPSDIVAAIKDRVAQFKGHTLMVGGPPANDLPPAIKIQLPAENYPHLLDFLQRLGRLEPPPPTLAEVGGVAAERIEIELAIIR